MKEPVLRFRHTGGDYEVVIRTQDIAHSWQRFRGRINYSRLANPAIDTPEEYCRYTAKDECVLSLYNPATGQTAEMAAGKAWEHLWPVMYETCKYQIRILFHGIDGIPEVRHVRRDIEEAFFDDEELSDHTEKSLTGEIDFLNEPGVFKLEFAYQKGGHRHEGFVTLDVVSPKLDTKTDYKTLLAEVNEEYENVIYRYLSLTVQQFSRGRISNDATWMTAFQSVVDDYVRGVSRVIQNPHSQTQRYRTSRRAEHIKCWTPVLEERYGEVAKQGKLEEYYFDYDETTSTNDTMENRFVKHTLLHIGRRLQQIIGTVLNSAQEELSERHRQAWVGYQQTIARLTRHPFFKTVGRYEGMRQESLVLQSRAGYQQIYKDWLKLRRGIDLYNGAANIGTLQIWEIYELWCFIRMKRMVADVMGISPDRPDYEQLVTEPRGTLLNPFINSSLEHIVKFRYPAPAGDDNEQRRRQLLAHAGDEVTLHYQHVFNRRSGDDGLAINTATTEQRPDIVLNIQRESGEVVLTYLYDAKYRVVNDHRLDRDFEPQDIAECIEMPGGDYPPTDAINQMHRYRDAIYYSRAVAFRSKEVIGGYILFPGRGEDKYISRRYYSESVESINIGAFPLLPGGGELLRKHLQSILMEHDTTWSHVAKAKPQRTLAYVTEEQKQAMPEDDLVMVAVTGDESRRQWCLDNKWYNIPLDKIPDAPWMQARYLLLYVRGEKKVGGLRKIVRSNHAVWTKDTLRSKGYPCEPSKDAYFMIRLHLEGSTDEELRNLVFDIGQSTEIVWGHSHSAFKLIHLSDLRTESVS